MAANLPSGTVTFLFTDIEGSTKLAQQHRATWEALRDRHHAILRSALGKHSGYLFEIVGDSFCVAFDLPANAVHAALQAQRDLHSEPWGDAPLRVRMGIHTGVAEPDGQHYRGYLALSSVSRILSAAHGGQVLLSQSTFELVEGDLPEGATLRNMGQHRLKDLLRSQHLYQLVVADLPCDFPPPKSLELHPHNLPIQLTSFVGREKEIPELSALIGSTRLLTLTGSGGTGKTRLALQVAAEVLDRFPDGAWFVDLASLSDPALVAQSVAGALSIHEQPGRAILDVLRDHLAASRLLLLLDNCEHLIDECAHLADALLHAAPELRILATSREPLGVAGEATFRVESLSLPDPSTATPEAVGRSDAVRLFIDRAVASQKDFRISDRNASAVAQICARLDGIPLAIELAAARISALNPEQIAARLDDRFKILTGKTRTALPRHQTLRATLDWSYSLLSEAEQLVMQRLSVFAGGWTLEAAEHVVVLEADQLDVLDLLTSLVDKSLVQMSDNTGRARYRMLETTRQYAVEKLEGRGETAAIRLRHAEYFADLAGRVESELEHGEFAAPQMMTGEQDNILTALEWALSGRAVQTGARLAVAMGHIWDTQALSTLQAYWARRARLHAKALPPHLKAGILETSARAEWIQNNVEEARRCGLEALAIFRELGNAHGIAQTLINLAGSSVGVPGEYAQARSWQAEALSIARQGRHARLESFALLVLGEVARSVDDYATARSTYEESLQHAIKIGDPLMEAISSYDLSLVYAHEREYSLALDAGRRALQGSVTLHSDVTSAYFLSAVAGAIGPLGQPDNAARLFGASEALLEQMGSRLELCDRRDCERAKSLVRAQIGVEKFDALLAEGRTMTLEEAIALAGHDA
jgi:predicted ATPase/class 3 adenylate cyclase